VKKFLPKKQKALKVLNLYAGIGGNRKLWKNVDVTAVENDENIAKIYQNTFPQDKVIIGDAHEYLLQHYKEFDFIWSSPPCPTHSRMNFLNIDKAGIKYPEMTLYQEILLLKSWFKGKFVVENVIPYYGYLIKPNVLLGRHPYWSNFNISNIDIKSIDISRNSKEKLAKHLGMSVPEYKGRLLLRNCVEPKVGLHILSEVRRAIFTPWIKL